MAAAAGSPTALPSCRAPFGAGAVGRKSSGSGCGAAAQERGSPTAGLMNREAVSEMVATMEPVEAPGGKAVAAGEPAAVASGGAPFGPRARGSGDSDPDCGAAAQEQSPLAAWAIGREVAGEMATAAGVAEALESMAAEVEKLVAAPSGGASSEPRAPDGEDSD